MLVNCERVTLYLVEGKVRFSNTATVFSALLTVAICWLIVSVLHFIWWRERYDSVTQLLYFSVAVDILEVCILTIN